MLNVLQTGASQVIIDNYREYFEVHPATLIEADERLDKGVQDSGYIVGRKVREFQPKIVIKGAIFAEVQVVHLEALDKIEIACTLLDLHEKRVFETWYENYRGQAYESFYFFRKIIM